MRGGEAFQAAASNHEQVRKMLFARLKCVKQIRHEANSNNTTTAATGVVASTLARARLLFPVFCSKLQQVVSEFNEERQAEEEEEEEQQKMVKDEWQATGSRNNNKTKGFTGTDFLRVSDGRWTLVHFAPLKHPPPIVDDVCVVAKKCHTSKAKSLNPSTRIT